MLSFAQGGGSALACFVVAGLPVGFVGSMGVKRAGATRVFVVVVVCGGMAAASSRSGCPLRVYVRAVGEKATKDRTPRCFVKLQPRVLQRDAGLWSKSCEGAMCMAIFTS